MSNRRTIEIKKWLLEKGLRQKDVAARAGVSRSTVNKIIQGIATSRTVVKALIDLGCPAEIFKKAA